MYVCFLLIFRTSLRTTLSRKLVVRPAGQNHFPLFTWGSSRTERRSSQIDSLVTNFRCWTTQTPFYLLWHRLIFSRSRFSSSSQLKWFLSLFGGHFQVDASSSRHNRKTVVNGFSNTLLLHFLIYLPVPLCKTTSNEFYSKPTKKKSTLNWQKRRGANISVMIMMVTKKCCFWKMIRFTK